MGFLRLVMIMTDQCILTKVTMDTHVLDVDYGRLRINTITEGRRILRPTASRGASAKDALYYTCICTYQCETNRLSPSSFKMCDTIRLNEHAKLGSNGKYQTHPGSPILSVMANQVASWPILHLPSAQTRVSHIGQKAAKVW